MKFTTVILAALAITVASLSANPTETMCVKQKDGTYRCKASGKIEKEPCCATPHNPLPKKKK